MTTLLQRAVAKAAELPPEQQDALAEFLLQEMADEARWDRAFARSEGALGQMAAEAVRENRTGMTSDLSPETLGRKD